MKTINIPCRMYPIFAENDHSNKNPPKSNLSSIQEDFLSIGFFRSLQAHFYLSYTISHLQQAVLSFLWRHPHNFYPRQQLSLCLKWFFLISLIFENFFSTYSFSDDLSAKIRNVLAIILVINKVICNSTIKI